MLDRIRFVDRMTKAKIHATAESAAFVEGGETPHDVRAQVCHGSHGLERRQRLRFCASICDRPPFAPHTPGHPVRGRLAVLHGLRQGREMGGNVLPLLPHQAQDALPHQADAHQAAGPGPPVDQRHRLAGLRSALLRRESWGTPSPPQSGSPSPPRTAPATPSGSRSRPRTPPGMQYARRSPPRTAPGTRSARRSPRCGAPSTTS